jgi:hypothetical protein
MELGESQSDPKTDFLLPCPLSGSAHGLMHAATFAKRSSVRCGMLCD